VATVMLDADRVVIAVAMLLASVAVLVSPGSVELPLLKVIVWAPEVPPGIVTATMTTPTCWLY